MPALPTTASGVEPAGLGDTGWQPLSPTRPTPDSGHEPRTVAAIARALREIPFYLARERRAFAEGKGAAPLPEVLARLPLLLKKDLRSTLPKHWVPAGRDTRAELASGALELVETSGSTGERLRVLWDAGWWMRQERRAMGTHPLVAAAMDGAQGEYREAILTSPACGVGTCHVGDRPYEERVLDELLFLNQRSDPLFWTAEEQTRMLDELTRHGAVGLESDPLYLAQLARFAKSRGRAIDVRGFVQLTYAFATQAYLRAIRSAYGGEVLQLYGASEIGVLFMQGEDGLLHHCPFTTHVELLPVRVSTPGARDVALVVATSLDRVAMPLVRFVLGDLVQVDPDGPRRWTTVAPLRSVEGRVDDAVVRPDGALVTAGAIDRALAPVQRASLWQVNQRAIDRVEVDVVPDGDSDAVVDEVRARLAPLFEGLELSARAATAIPIEQSGKFRVSKRHFPVELDRLLDPSPGDSAVSESLSEQANAIDAFANRLRPEFPMLSRMLEGQPVAFLDSASTTPKPRTVIQAVVDYYERCTANVHRGVHALGYEATQLYDAARLEAAGLVGAAPDEIVFVRGTTEAINLLAHALSLGPGDEVVFPASEHHANWLPWRVRARPVPMAIDEDGVPRWETLASLLTGRTRLVALGHVSNVTGCIAPVEEVVRTAHAHGVPVLLDAAQSLSHLPIDVKALEVDFLAASSHKAFGPSGVGFLYAKRERLREFPLYQVGGGMVAMNEDIGGAERRGFVPREVPFRFEAGTPAIEATIGFGAAVRWMRALGMQAIREHDVLLARYLVQRLRELPGVRVLAADTPAERRIALATFVVDAPGMTQENVARALCDMFGVCVSGGFHCTHVLHARAHLDGTVRASPHVFNTASEIDRLVEGVREIAS